MGINKKIVMFLTIAIGTIVVCLVSAGFLSVRNMRLDMAGQKQEQEAEMFSNFIAQRIENEVDDIKTYLTSPWWHDAVKEANLRYVTWEPKEIKEYMRRLDEQWIPAATDSQFIQEWLNSRMSQRLKLLTGQDIVIAEMFLTDQYGGLVAASGKTSDFYQADEEWWQRAYNNGKGDIFFSDVGLDESSGKISSAVAVPIKDESGQIIGVSKTALDIAVLFQPLIKYKFGKTGHVALLDEHGDVVYHAGFLPMSKSGVTGFELDRLLKKKNRFAMIKGCSKNNSLVAVSKVNSSTLEANRIDWVVVVSQERNEILFPLQMIFGVGLILIVIISLVIILILRNIIQRIFIFPLQKIQDGVRRFSDGELDNRIELKSADELELLAESLNEMSARLKQTMISRDVLAHEIKLRKHMDEALKLKTQELAVNLEESLKSREVLSSMLADNSQTREKLENSLKQLKEMHLQLIHAEKMEAVGRMASGVAHEVKNPLGIILQGIDYFEGELPLKRKDYRQTLVMMKDSVKRADNIVRALLDFSRNEDLKIEPQEINTIIENSIILVQHKFKLNSIECVLELGRGLPKTFMDKGKLEQVFVNLFNNAVDALAGGGKLYVRSYLSELKSPIFKIGTRMENVFRLGEKAIIVEVEDTGVGIDEDIMSKIFDPFFTTKNRTVGTGLGLSIVKSMVEMHSAWINVESKKGKGTKFTIIFKIA